MKVDEHLAALKDAFLTEIDELWGQVPDLAGSGNPELARIAAHHLDYTRQHREMFLNELASISVLYRHLLDEEIEHRDKAQRRFGELAGGGGDATAPQAAGTSTSSSEGSASDGARSGGSNPGGAGDLGNPVAPVATPPAGAPLDGPVTGLTVGSLRGRPQQRGDAE